MHLHHRRTLAFLYLQAYITLQGALLMEGKYWHRATITDLYAYFLLAAMNSTFVSLRFQLLGKLCTFIMDEVETDGSRVWKTVKELSRSDGDVQEVNNGNRGCLFIQ